MIPTMKSLGIDQLPRDVQLALVQEIWENIAAEGKNSPLSENQRQELERRLVDDESNPNDVFPWEQVKAKAIERVTRS